MLNGWLKNTTDMETKFNSQICTTRSQSEALLKLGLKKETADMLIMSLSSENDIIALPWVESGGWTRDNSIPAWSLHRLIEMIDDECVIHLDNFTIVGRLFEVYDNLFDNLIDCIEWLIKEGYFPKEYLA